MKKLILTLCSAVLLLSCNSETTGLEETQEQILSKSQIENATLKQKLAYKKHYLQEALKTVKDLGFTTNDILKLSKKQNAQEKTFVLDDFLKLANERNMRVSSEKVSKIKELNNAFRNLDGRSYNISFYVPFADKLQEKTSNTKNAKLASMTEEIYIFEQQDISDQTAFEGYVLNEDSQYVTYDQLVTEELADELATENTAVIIVGLQENTLALQDSEGNLIDVSAGTTGSSGTSSALATRTEFRILDMAVKTHKESWIAGASELTIRGFKFYNGLVQSTFNSNSTSHGGLPEMIFRKFSRKEVSNRNLITLHSNVARSNVNEMGTLYYVIYEADNWPATTRTVNFNVNGQNTQLKYFSSDLAYISNSSQSGIPPSNIYGLPYIENGEIKYRTFFINL